MESSRDVLALCAELGQTLHESGAPVHRLESAVDAVRQSYDFDGATVATPTALWLQVGNDTRVLRLRGGNIDLTRLVSVLRLVDRLVEKRVPVAWASAALRRRQQLPSPWPLWGERLAFVASSMAAAVLLGGSVQDTVLAGLAGGIALAVLGRVGTASAWMPVRDALLAAVLGALGALGAAIGAHPTVVAVSGAILIVPGLSLTTALFELAAGHWSAGGARLVGATLSLAQLAAGLAVGMWAVGTLPALLEPVMWSPVVPRLVLLGAPAAFGVLLRTRRVDLPVVWLTALLAGAVASTVGGLPGALLGGLTVALAAGSIGRMARVPDVALVAPGILLLVPGTMGVLGVEQLISRNLEAGALTAIAALETAGCIAAGLFIGQALLQSIEVKLRTPNVGALALGAVHSAIPRRPNGHTARTVKGRDPGTSATLHRQIY